MTSREDARDYFYGDKARAETARRFHVSQRAHYINLSNKPVKGLFRDDLKEVYFIELTDKTDPQNAHTHVVGYHVAESLFKLAGQKPLPLFDPLKSSRGGKATGDRDAPDVDNRKSKQRTALNEEVYRAVNIFLSAHGISNPDRIFGMILTQVQDYPDRDIFDSKVKGFNTAIKRFGKNPKKLHKIIADLKKKHPELRDFSFPLMEKILGADSYLGKPSILTPIFSKASQP